MLPLYANTHNAASATGLQIGSETAPRSSYLESANALVEAALREYPSWPLAKAPPVSPEFEALRWFWLPEECLAELRGAG